MPNCPDTPFALVDRYIGTRMDCDLAALAPGRTVVVETPRRLHREAGYGYGRALWWIWLEDGRSAISVPPGVAPAVRKIAREVESRERLSEPALAEQLKASVNPVLEWAGLGGVDRVFADVQFACDGRRLLRHRCGDCCRLTDESVPPAEGLKLPTHCFPDGIAYAVVADGVAASIAFAHRHGVMEGVIADLAITTGQAYRRRGYAKTAVSAVVEHVTCKGGQALYACRPGNHASVATAGSVGFVPYARSLVLGVPGGLRPE